LIAETDSIKNIQKIIIENWKSFKRDYSWRKNINPYRIMIAEFMLQRTKANQVESVYKSFIKQYQDINSLAKARAHSIQKYTINLGIHWRAAHFKEAAKYIMDNYDGQFPEDRTLLRKIPGIGDYVAGAILTVCFNRPEYVVDSNIARFINRFYGLQLTGEIRRKKPIIEKAQELFDYSDTRNLLFALLDFTALVCKPQKPECTSCILNQDCSLKSKYITPL